MLPENIDKNLTALLALTVMAKYFPAEFKASFRAPLLLKSFLCRPRLKTALGKQRGR